MTILLMLLLPICVVCAWLFAVAAYSNHLDKKDRP